MSLKTGVAVKIVRAKPAGAHRLEMTFSDGHISTVDFGPFLRGSLHPDTRQFLNTKMFRRFSVAHGNLVWGDYEMCFPIEDLYQGAVGTEEPSAKALAVAETRADYIAKRNAAPTTCRVRSSARRKR